MWDLLLGGGEREGMSLNCKVEALVYVHSLRSGVMTLLNNSSEIPIHGAKPGGKRRRERGG